MHTAAAKHPKETTSPHECRTLEQNRAPRGPKEKAKKTSGQEPKDNQGSSSTKPRINKTGQQRITATLATGLFLRHYVYCRRPGYVSRAV
eukprot:3750778-Amphidinium_carterae.1